MRRSTHNIIRMVPALLLDRPLPSVPVSYTCILESVTYRKEWREKGTNLTGLLRQIQISERTRKWES